MRAMRRFAEPRRGFFAGDDHGGRAVIGAGSIAGGDGAVFFECRAQFGESFERCVGARRFIASQITIGSPFFCGTSIGTICDSTKQDFIACKAR